MTTNRTVRVFEDGDQLAHEAARYFTTLAAQRAQVGQPFSVALAGGSTPRTLYSLLTASPYRESIAWDNLHFFFGDERCVPPDNKDSNYRMVQELLLAALAASQLHVSRMPAELADPDVAARQYEAELQRFFSLTPGQFPRFDLILLGMGPDGHTASLFPHKPALHERQRLVVASEPGLEPFVTRLTLTYPVLNHAANVLFLVEKEDKAETVARVLQGPADPDALPSQAVQPTEGSLMWFLDYPAASKLKAA